MSARSTRVATAGTLALALALALPAAAFADDEERGRSETAPHGSAQNGSSDSGQKADDTSSDNSDGERKGSDRRSSGRTGDDPRGNNGTVKIDGEAFDDGRGNEPHVGCTFAVDFYGFDAGDTATITFTGHAPTGGGLLHSESRTISTDAAGGGQDRDATLVYSVDDQLSELRAVTPHPQQGWHVTLAVDVDDAPGGAKQKVFWIDCPAPALASGAAAPSTTGAGTATGTATVSGTTSGAATGVVSSRSVASSVLPATLVSGTTVAAAERQDALTLGAGSATLASDAVAAQGAVSPSVLPFTGTQALVGLLATGVAALGLGGLAARLGRRASVVAD